MLNQDENQRPLVKIGVDCGQKWSMSTIFWPESPDWEKLLSPQLYADLFAWGNFFDDHANEVTGLFGSEELRKHFDLEGIRLVDRLEDEVGNQFRFKLHLWF